MTAPSSPPNDAQDPVIEAASLDELETLIRALVPELLAELIGERGA